jgi:hypothetical protein
MLNNIKCTPFCYTKELIDALVDVNQTAKKMVQSDEAKMYRNLKYSIYDLEKKFPGNEESFANAKTHIDEKCEEFSKQEAEAGKNYESKVQHVCDVVYKMLRGKFVTGDNKFVRGLVLVNDVKLGGFYNTAVMATGDYIDLNLVSDEKPKQYGFGVWPNESNGISTVANLVEQQVNSGKIPMSADGTQIQMLYIVEPDDALEWLKERKEIIDNNRNGLKNLFDTAKRAFGDKDKVENDKV